MINITTFFQLLSLSLWSGERFFTKLEEDQKWKEFSISGRMGLFFFGFCLIVLILAALVGQISGKVIDFGLQENPRLQNLPNIPRYYFPYSKLLFVFFWMGYLLFATVTRHFFMKILGEKESNFPWTFSITLFSAIPLILCNMVSSIILDFFPFLPDRSTNSVLIQLFLTFAIFSFGFFREYKLFSYMNGKVFLQNRGRAFLTWSFPVFFTLSFLFVVIVLYSGSGQMP